MAKTKLQKDAEKAIDYRERLLKAMESEREENARIREAKDKVKSEEMEAKREENARIREVKDKAKSEEMEAAREESGKKYGYKKGGLVRQGKPKLAKKGWR